VFVIRVRWRVIARSGIAYSRRSEILRIFATIKVAATKTTHTAYLKSSRAAEQQNVVAGLKACEFSQP